MSCWYRVRSHASTRQRYAAATLPCVTGCSQQHAFHNPLVGTILPVSSVIKEKGHPMLSQVYRRPPRRLLVLVMSLVIMALVVGTAAAKSRKFEFNMVR